MGGGEGDGGRGNTFGVLHSGERGLGREGETGVDVAASAYSGVGML